MDTCESAASSLDWPDRWNHLRKLLERGGPLAHPEFEASPELLDIMLEHVRVLVIGAGGLGCELLKDLALMGFRQIDVIDMDTIDLSNLNRQFLFRQSDIGKPKAEVAARFINNRVPGCNVTPHYKRIQDYDEDFYAGFQIIVCGLDSILARRWINGMLLSFLNYDEDGSVDPEKSQIIPLVDGGTEGFKGNARVIVPGTTACIECTLDLYPPQLNFPMCTLAHTPRLPEHCVEYVRVLLWPQEWPMGDGVAIDGDDPAHIKWIHDKALARAEDYGIQGVNYRLTQGVVKRIIPAVASTNAVIAAACASEVFKLVSLTSNNLSNYVVFNDVDGVLHSHLRSREENRLSRLFSKPTFAELQRNGQITRGDRLFGGESKVPNEGSRPYHRRRRTFKDSLYAKRQIHRRADETQFEKDAKGIGSDGRTRVGGG